MAVKIKLARIGKIREPFYRVVVADARTRRSGRAIEAIGKYHPKNDPSVIEIDSERAQYWLSVGAQPTEQVMALLKITGDWQTYKGLPGTEGTLRVKAPKEAPVIRTTPIEKVEKPAAPQPAETENAEAPEGTDEQAEAGSSTTA